CLDRLSAEKASRFARIGDALGRSNVGRTGAVSSRIVGGCMGGKNRGSAGQGRRWEIPLQDVRGPSGQQPVESARALLRLQPGCEPDGSARDTEGSPEGVTHRL